MDEFDFCYQERNLPFQEGAEKGKNTAEHQRIEEIEAEAQQFGLEVSLFLSTSLQKN
jgi:hypothetical protein